MTLTLNIWPLSLNYWQELYEVPFITQPAERQWLLLIPWTWLPLIAMGNYTYHEILSKHHTTNIKDFLMKIGRNGDVYLNCKLLILYCNIFIGFHAIVNQNKKRSKFESFYYLKNLFITHLFLNEFFFKLDPPLDIYYIPLLYFFPFDNFYHRIIINNQILFIPLTLFFYPYSLQDKPFPTGALYTIKPRLSSQTKLS